MGPCGSGRTLLYFFIYEQLRDQREQALYSHCGYTLRPRKHELCLVNKSRLDEQNLCTDYSSKICTDLNWHELNFTFYFISFTFVLICMYCLPCTCIAAFWQLFTINEYQSINQSTIVSAVIMSAYLWGRGTPLPPLSIYFLIFSLFTFPFLSLALPIFFFYPSLPFLPE